MKQIYNIYMSGVGGQGIGLLSELLARAAGHAGLEVHGCDTHGLAQRGGMVSSHLRLGAAASPLIRPASADLVLSLERSEALRAAQTMLKAGGTLVWYDTAWQALDVRSGTNPAVTPERVHEAAAARQAAAFAVYRPELPDVRMQNMVLVAELLTRQLLPGIGLSHVTAAMQDLMGPAMYEKNRALLPA
ncbi:MAG: 2-oxoacid:acceptor oxidoreductase family protein [Spirochaetes bacterium]|nr:2-oxoacid:acceptor oxidoreductase family protein [Spirochaetota bacterium]